MPIVIKELVITTVVDANAAQNQQVPDSTPPAAALEKQVVETCVAQVLAILDERKER